MQRRSVLTMIATAAPVLAARAAPPAKGRAAPARTPAAPAAPTLPTAAPEAVGLIGQRVGQVMEVLNGGVAEGRINGAVFGIVRRGRLATFQAVGWRDTARQEPLKTDAIFPLGGMTRPIVAVAAMTLVERGKLKLADPLSIYLPAFQEMRVATDRTGPDGKPVTAPARRLITIQDLLRQTAGFAAGGDPAQPLADAVDALAKQPLAREPGSAWDDGPAMDVLARVVETVAGLPIERVIAATVTGPLRMVDTGYAVPEKDRGRIAQPCIDPLSGSPPPGQDMTQLPPRRGGDTGLVGTAMDYLRFAEALLEGGALDGARVLGGGTVRHMTSDHLGAIPHDTPAGARLLGQGRGYGLGVSVRLAQGVSPDPGSAGDYGWSGSAGPQFVVDPELDLVAVLMLNQPNQFDHYARLFRTLVYETVGK